MAPRSVPEMTSAVILDVVLLLAFAANAVRLYRAGLVTAALSLAGLLTGGFLALWLLPELLLQWSPLNDQPTSQGILLLIGALVSAAIGQQIGHHLGTRLRSQVRSDSARTVDSLLGAVASVLVGALLAWCAAGAVRGALPEPAERAVSESRVLRVIGTVMPAEASRLFPGIRDAITHGFPEVFSDRAAESVRPVDPPDPDVAQGRGVTAAAKSVVKVSGNATQCRRGQQGSGWVAAPQRVVTNAHVVAGVSKPSVQIGGVGRRYPATTVAFDPDRDVAVLAVPGLDADPLPAGPRQGHGDSVVVAGFPLGGPYDLEAGRVRDLVSASGDNIYKVPGVDRQVYAVSAKVEHGNSGGPLLSPSGQVVGTVFAKSTTDTGTGYALTLDETRSVVAAGSRAAQPVSTGRCTE